MAHQFNRISCLFAVAVSVLAGGAVALPGDPPDPAQADDPSGDKATGSARTIAEVRGLVAELEAQVERQRSQLQTTEASLKRARALLNELEETQVHSQQTYPQNNPNHSLDEEHGLRDQAAARTMEWKWSEDQATAYFSARTLRDGYQAQFTPTPGKPWESTIALIRDGHTVFSWQGHENSVFVSAHDVLYRAQFEPGRTGCQVIADDLKGGKRLWETYLWGVRVDSHSQYRNRINLEIDDRHVIVYGNESFGRYIELLDPKTGRTVGHRLVEGRDSDR